MSPLSMRERLATMAVEIESLEADRLQARRAANDCSGDEKAALSAENHAGLLKDTLAAKYREFFLLASGFLSLVCITHGATPLDGCPDCDAAPARAAGGMTT